MISLFLEQYLYFTNQSNFTGQLRTPLFGKILKPQTPSLYKGGEKGGGGGGAFQLWLVIFSWSSKEISLAWISNQGILP